MENTFEKILKDAEKKGSPSEGVAEGGRSDSVIRP